MRDLLSALKAIVRWKSAPLETKPASPAEATKEQPSLALFSPEGNCGECRNYRPRAGESGAKAGQEAAALCSIRGFDIREPLTTFCKNFSAPNEPPLGAIYSILGTHGGVALPWFDLTAPSVAPATCCMCGAASEAGIRLELYDGTVECCSPQHYLDWWTDYLCRRLDYFKLLGERAYSDMYDVISPSAATAYYSDAKEAFYSAISTARDLELRAEQHALEERLAHIKAVFRSQFR
jgi:hypothetical protein